jgi:transposase
MSATVGGVPQKRGLINDADQARILTALRERDEWEAALRESVVTAARHGASVRELAAFTGLSTNTISRWKRGE